MNHDRTVEERVDPRLLDLGHSTRRNGGLPIEKLERGDVVQVQTRNTNYIFRVLDSSGRSRKVQLSGSKAELRGPFWVVAEGACEGEVVMKPGLVSLYLGVAFVFPDERRIHTSAVLSITVNSQQIAP